MRIKSSSYFSVQYLCRILCLISFLFVSNNILATDSCIHTTTAGKTLDTDLGCLYTALNQTYGGIANKQWTAYPYGGSGPLFQITCSSSGICTNDGAPVSCPTGEGVNIYKPASGSCTAMKIYYEFPPTPGITSVSPVSGTAGQSIAVTVAGSNFATGAKVKISRSGNVISATGVTVVDANTITCNLPLPSNAVKGSWDVVVTNTTQMVGTGVGLFTVINEHAPSVTSFTKTGPGDVQLAFGLTDFTDHFTDPDAGDTLQEIQILNLPTHGTLKLSGVNVIANQKIASSAINNLTYTPTLYWNGNDSFSYNGSDGELYAASAATVTLTITAVNHPPTISDIAKSLSENGYYVFNATDFTGVFSSVDSGKSLSKIQIISLPTSGSLTLSGVSVTVNQEIPVANLGNLKYMPCVNCCCSASFSWNGADNVPSYALSARSVSFTINPLVPTANNGSKTGSQDVNVKFSSTDFTIAGGDGSSIEKIKITSLPTYGRLKLLSTDVTLNQEILYANLNDLELVLDEGWHGQTNFNFKAYNGKAYTSNDGVISVTINEVVAAAGGSYCDQNPSICIGAPLSAAGILMTAAGAYIGFKRWRVGQAALAATREGGASPEVQTSMLASIGVQLTSTVVSPAMESISNTASAIVSTASEGLQIAVDTMSQMVSGTSPSVDGSYVPPPPPPPPQPFV